MATSRVVVIGASAGGLQALIDIVGQLPKTTTAAILIAVHTKTEGDSFLPEILRRNCPMPIAFADHSAKITPGTIVVAPPNHHLLVLKDRALLNRGPKENGFRPAIDPLFRTAARWHGAGVMGIILSGALDDGAYGLRMVHDGGGVTVVQDPEEAAHPSMPLSALRAVDATHVLKAADIGRLIATGSSTPNQGVVKMARRHEEPEPQDPAQETTVDEMNHGFGPPSALTCPDCGGALWEIHNGQLMRYRCHVGHQYTTEALDAEQQQVVEGALWSAVRLLEERAELRRRMAEHAEQHGMAAVSSGFTGSADESSRQADTIRGLLFGGEQPAAPKRTRRATPATARTKGRRRPR